MMLARQRSLATRFCQLLSVNDFSLMGGIAQLDVTSSWTSLTAPSALPPAPAPSLASLWSYTQTTSFAKASKSKPGKKGKDQPAEKESPAAASGPVAAYDIASFEKGMDRAIEHLQHELANIRTGRATPGMLDHLRVDVYGEKMPLKAVGTVSVRDAQTLAVTVFDPQTVDAISAAIRESPLQLNPRVEGQEMLVPIPRPTAETMAAMAKVCKGEGEGAKVSIRHVRKLAMEAVGALPSEDEQRRAEREVQTLTDRYVADIERIVAAKQKDIASHNS